MGLDLGLFWDACKYMMMGDAAKLIAFSSATEPTTVEKLFGTLKTVSRAVTATAPQSREISCKL